MPLQLIGALLGSILVTTISVVQSYDIINKKRDQIVSGYIDGNPISVFHRKMIYLNDWLPLVIYIEAFMIIFSIIIIATPFVLVKNLKDQWGIPALYLVGAMLPLSAVIASHWYTFMAPSSDQALILCVLREEKNKYVKMEGKDTNKINHTGTVLFGDHAACSSMLP